MRIAFVRPNLYAGRSSDAMEPLAFAILAGCTPQDCEVELYDERLEDIPERLEVDLVAITVETFTARRAYQLASRFERQGIPVVAGGYHATFCSEEALRYVRSVVIGDGDDIWPDVVQDARVGKLKRRYQSHFPGYQNALWIGVFFAASDIVPWLWCSLEEVADMRAIFVRSMHFTGRVCDGVL